MILSLVERRVEAAAWGKHGLRSNPAKRGRRVYKGLKHALGFWIDTTYSSVLISLTPRYN